MPFTLQVRFSGVCLFVYDRPEGSQHDGPIPVLLPDARNTGKKQRMFDWTVPDPHVGYLRWSSANQVAGAPPADVYHRFDHTHVMIQGLAGDAIDIGHLRRGVIHFDEVADDLACPDRFTDPHDEQGLASPEGRVNALIELQGGRFLQPESGGNWVFSNQLNPPGPPADQRFPDKARQIIWQADIEGDEVRIVLRNAGGEETAVVLRPANDEDTVLVDIANVCAGDLVDWEEVRPWDGVDNRRPDQDFVWFYRLVQHCGDPDWETHLRGFRFPVPYPDLTPGAGGIFLNCLLGAARPFEVGGLAEEDPPDLQANHEPPPAPGAGEEVLDADQPPDPIDPNYTFAPNTLALEPVKQTKSNWCWAASAEMALDRLKNMVGLPEPTPDQTEVADQVLQGGTGGNPPNSPIPVADVPRVYDPWPQVDAFPYQGANPLQMIQRQIAVGRPVLSVRETNPAYDWYHMEVVRGWAGSADLPEIVLNDPQIGKERWVMSGFKPTNEAVFEDWDGVDWRFWYFLSEV